MQLEVRNIDKDTVSRLTAAGVAPFLAQLLCARGVTDPKEAFLRLEDLIPYNQLKNSEEFAKIVADAIAQKERILIIADYDADGATACATGYLALKAMGANVDYLIPHRIDHGYGLTLEIATVACNQTPKPKYVITVDNGISSFEGISYCNSQGVSVLVTDHHLAADKLPDARVIVNPNQPDCTFPSKALAGCGVIFYCMWALQDELLERGATYDDPSFDVFSLLPITAIGTVADVVPLDFNNRILVSQGLIRLRKKTGEFPGIEKLAAQADKQISELTTTDIAFGIGPRINAAGRLDSMNAGVKCLVTKDPLEAALLARTLHEINQQRKEIESDIVEEALTRLIKEVELNRWTAVLAADSWHQGVIGIVAGRIKEKIWRPTFVFTKINDTQYKGSGRSIPGFHLRDALDLVDKRVPGALLKFGGHAMAAGATIAADKFQEFKEAFEEIAHELLRPADLAQILECDGPLPEEDLVIHNILELKQYVWGQCFPEPVFLDTFAVAEARLVGQGQHLRLKLTKGNSSFVAMKFRHSDPCTASTLKVAYTVDLNKYNGNTSVQLITDYIEAV